MDGAKRDILESYFDAGYYRRRYGGELEGLDPFEHYLRAGLAANRRPSLRFDPLFYLDRYKDVRRRGYPAMEHFLNAGRAEGRFATQAEELNKGGLLGVVAARRLLAERDSGRVPEGAALLESVEALLDASGAGEPERWESRFDDAYYLAQHADVAKGGGNPLLHYLKAGQTEKRRTSLDVLDELVAGGMKERPELPGCLLFVNEMGRTGAPVVALELARVLAQKFNLVCISRTGGALEAAFSEVCAAYTVKCRSPADAHLFVRDCVSRLRVAFAVLNSVEATMPLPALLANGVAAVSLIHEYAQYTLPREKLHQAVLLSDHLVFSSGHVMETWRKEMDHAFGTDFSHRSVMHQPAARHVLDRRADRPRAEVRAELAARRGLPLEDRLVVMGGGSVQIRKGFELFLQTAKAVAGMQAEGAAPAGGKKPFFLWIGKGLDEADRAYGLWLREEVGRMPPGLFAWLPPDPDFHDFVASSDIFFISSRLDPFPNVAIDALLLGSLPMFFDDATGFQELVERHGLPHIKARHLDAHDAARKILAHDPDAVRGDAAQASAAIDFEAGPYVAQVLRLAEAAVARADEPDDGALETILDTGFAVLPFAGSPLDRGDEALLKRRFWRKLIHGGVQAFNPRPGCDMRLAFRESAPAHGLLRDTHRVLREPVPSAAGTGAVVFLHLSTGGRLPDASLPGEPALVVAAGEGLAAAEIRAAAAGQGFGRYTVLETGGRGFHGALSDAAGEGLFDGFDLVVAARGDAASLRPLLDVAGAFQRDPALGLVFPDSPLSPGWGQFHEAALALVGPEAALGEAPGPFPQGAAFAIRRLLLDRLLPRLGRADAEDEALDRLWPALARAEGFGFATLAPNVNPPRQADA